MVGLYADGSPGEIFVVMSKEGSTISGLMDAFATSISIALQYGVPLRVLVNKFIHTRFEPAGMTNNPEIRFAKSVVDYIFRYLGLKYLSKEDQDAMGLAKTMVENNETQAKLVEPAQKQAGQKIVEHESPNRLEPDLLTFDPQSDPPACDNCAIIMISEGPCYNSPNSVT